MSKKPNLSELLPLFEAQSDFSLTEKQYAEKRVRRYRKILIIF